MLIDIADIKLSVWIASDDDTQYDFLRLVYNKSVGYVENYIWYSIESPKYPQEMIVECTWKRIFVEYFENMKIEKVEKNIGSDFVSVWEEVWEEEYFLENNGILNVKNPVFWKKAFKIVYTYWFQKTNLPKDIQWILLWLIGYFKSQSWAGGDIKSETVDGDRIEFGKYVGNGVLENLNAQLDKYKRYDVYS